MPGFLVCRAARAVKDYPMSRRPLILAVGEVLWDVFPAGPRFGGAPANFACHAAALGAEVALFSRVGCDDAGNVALATLAGHGVETAFIQRDEHAPTGTVGVRVDAAGAPQFTIHADAAWDQLTWTDALADFLARADAVYFGTLAQRTAAAAATIRRVLDTTPTTALRILDVNLRPPFDTAEVLQQSLRRATVLKLSREELPTIAALHTITGTELEMLSGLRNHLNLEYIALTRGGDGAAIAGPHGIVTCDGMPTTVVDTVGAGDAWTAAFAAGLLAGHPLAQIAQHACRVAAYVCAHPGAVPQLPPDLRSLR